MKIELDVHTHTVASGHAYSTLQEMAKAGAEKGLTQNTGKPLEIIEKDTDRDNYMTAEEALDYGLIDKILTRRP